MSPMPLTASQRRAKEAIALFMARHGHAPKVHELAQMIGRSQSNACRAIDRLVEHGHARRTSAASRNIELVADPVSAAPDGQPLFYVGLADHGDVETMVADRFEGGEKIASIVAATGLSRSSVQNIIYRVVPNHAQDRADRQKIRSGSADLGVAVIAAGGHR